MVDTAGLRFDANLSILFTDLPLLERPAAAAAAGFDSVELWWPFSTPTPDAPETDALYGALQDAGTSLVGLNFDAGDMPAGDRGLLSVPDFSDRFRANIGATVAFAERTGCRTLNALYGNRVSGVDPVEQDALAVDNLTRAARAAAHIGATVVVENQNPVGSPAYPWTSAAQIVAVLDRVREEGGVELGWLCDVHHLVISGEDPPAALRQHADRVRHVQIADAPGRHEPGSGEIDFGALFDTLRAVGYRQLVGLEYAPSAGSAASLGWLPPEHRPTGAVIGTEPRR